MGPTSRSYSNSLGQVSHNCSAFQFIFHQIIMIIIIMVISKRYFTREHIAQSYKKTVYIELGKTIRLKALLMMQNSISNKQTVSMTQRQSMKKSICKNQWKKINIIQTNKIR